MFDLFTPKTESKAGKNTEEDANKKPLPTDVDSLEMNWFGLQFVRKVKGTQEIQQRSFPFWLTTIEEGLEYAKKTNRMKKEDRTYWSHLVVWSSITETKSGRRTNEIAVKEIEIK